MLSMPLVSLFGEVGIVSYKICWVKEGELTGGRLGLANISCWIPRIITHVDGGRDMSQLRACFQY